MTIIEKGGAIPPDGLQKFRRNKAMFKKITSEIKNRIWKYNEKAFPSKCYVCMGDHAQDRFFSSKKAALEFLSNNANKGYNVMMPCKGTGIL